ncbi:hypothetical protein [Ensifer sp. LC163]|uniref:hypothetical protein n=1 Tax=Ensifer sp. LC163 TaxID=1120652 RepID=UPI000B0BACF0|nr:hypothetical protein [Ensifer sp. LC163]
MFGYKNHAGIDRVSAQPDRQGEGRKMVMALLRAKLDESKRLQSPGEENFGATPRLEVSDPILKSLQKLNQR